MNVNTFLSLDTERTGSNNSAKKMSKLLYCYRKEVLGEGWRAKVPATVVVYRARRLEACEGVGVGTLDA